MLGNLMANLKLAVQQQQQQQPQQPQPQQGASDAGRLGLESGTGYGGMHGSQMEAPSMVPVSMTSIPVPFSFSM